ncbi:hypothetical protein ABIB38_000859 [Massilia sp. UYP11]|uniref:PEP-CTERM sorting domain-containing protein n=1 Tax=Massilia sp. UYP11 TaxID=1756385 RepID=UPI003D259E75
MAPIIPYLFAAALLAQPAQAAVTYSWHEVGTSPISPPGLNMELVFSDDAVAQGKLELDFVNMCDLGEPCLDGQDSLLSLRYWYAEPWADEGRANYIDYGHRKLPAHYFDRIRLNLTFLPGGLLDGYIYANDGNSHVEIASLGGLFTVVNAHSDEPFGCNYFSDPCSGSTGYLAGASIEGEVPEPSSVLLAGLGLAAIGFARRRRARRD